MSYGPMIYVGNYLCYLMYKKGDVVRFNNEYYLANYENMWNFPPGHYNTMYRANAWTLVPPPSSWAASARDCWISEQARRQGLHGKHTSSSLTDTLWKPRNGRSG